MAPPKPPEEPPKPPPAPEKGGGEDELTQLPHVGGGRAKKLASEGIKTFKQVSELGPDKLAKSLNVTADQATEICEAAFDKAGG